ncbi:serine hydrolase-like protein 2 isoform X1 [Xenopus laevis]|uniref:Serine hydrolase-like protein 2 isoform X1 n=1 Tax=Xenopus laevis TaxID=8355 RepID=A0A8J1MZ79_XENLA|nr:serine hydrolase-like protein 2 isoform X1 [Xenopus laevis]
MPIIYLLIPEALDPWNVSREGDCPLLTEPLPSCTRAAAGDTNNSPSTTNRNPGGGTSHKRWIPGRRSGQPARSLERIIFEYPALDRGEQMSPQIEGSAHSSELRINVPWGYLAAKSWGPREGKLVLCLHGWLDNASSFDKLIPLLPQGYHYVALDFTGHGLSSHKPLWTKYDFIDFVIDAYKALMALGGEKVTVLGHSLGGLVGTLLASTYPEIIENVILLDTYGFYPQIPHIFIKHFKYSVLNYVYTDVTQAKKTYTPDDALQRLLKANKALTAESGKILLQRGTKEIPDGLTFTHDPRISLMSMPPLTLEYCCHMMKTIQANVLAIIASNGLMAKKGKMFDPEDGKVLLRGWQENIKCFQLANVNGNHFVHLNNAENVSGIISSFLQKKPHYHSKL